MRLLLDTHAFIWALSDPDRLGDTVRREVADPANEVFVSAASIWEISVKRAIGKIALPPAFAGEVAARGFAALPITLEHAERAGGLCPHHRDPFDRMLVAQAAAESLTVVTHDDVFARYGVGVLPI